jgi:hypothetical protein
MATGFGLDVEIWRFSGGWSLAVGASALVRDSGSRDEIFRRIHPRKKNPEDFCERNPLSPV